jgi:hypothetical protein
MARCKGRFAMFGCAAAVAIVALTCTKTTTALDLSTSTDAELGRAFRSAITDSSLPLSFLTNSVGKAWKKFTAASEPLAKTLGVEPQKIVEKVENTGAKICASQIASKAFSLASNANAKGVSSFLGKIGTSAMGLFTDLCLNGFKNVKERVVKDNPQVSNVLSDTIVCGGSGTTEKGCDHFDKRGCKWEDATNECVPCSCSDRFKDACYKSKDGAYLEEPARNAFCAKTVVKTLGAISRDVIVCKESAIELTTPGQSPSQYACKEES